MKLVIQRVSHASVSIDGRVVGRIDAGLLVLVGVATDDTEQDVQWLAQKTANMRIFDDDNGVMNLSVSDVGGQVLAVSQFTLQASTRKGNRPSYIRAAGHQLSVPLYELFCSEMERLLTRPVERGVFGANMQVELVNDGPVTIVVDSKNKC